MNRPTLFSVCVILLLGLAVGPALAQPIIDQCSITTPSPQFGDNGVAMVQDTIDIVDVGLIADTQIVMDINTAFVGDMAITLTSPDSILVMLHSNLGGSNDDLMVTYNDQGIANGLEPFDCACAMQVSGPGVLADYNGSNTVGAWVLDITDTFPTSGGGTLDNWCVRIFDVVPPPPPVPVENLTCLSTSGTGVADVSWTNPIVYDEINIYINNSLIETIGGTETSYSTPVQPFPDVISVCVEPVATGAPASQRCCDVGLVAAADLEVCNTPGSTISATLPRIVDFLEVVDDQDIEDLQISVDITHTFIGDLDISVVSPAGTVLKLHNNVGGTGVNINLIYWELGIPNGSLAYDCACLMQPSGPGSLLDYFDETTAGTWLLIIDDNAGGNDGVLNQWCVRSFLTGPTFPVEDVACVQSSPGTIDATWTNISTYDSINILINNVLVANLPGDATGFSSDPQPFPATATLCVEAVSPGGVPTTPQCCTVSLFIDPVSAVACTPNGDVVDVSWVNGAPYDGVNVFVNGALEASLAGTATSYTTNTIVGPFPANVQICIEGVFGSGTSVQACCSALLLAPADSETCINPGSLISSVLPVTTETIDVPDDLQIGDTELLVGITHTFNGDLNITLDSPQATQITLHNQGGGANDNINLVYSDNGIANSDPYNCGCAMQPSGPGAMADYNDESSLGLWTFTVTDLLGGDEGTIDLVCVRIFEGCPIVPPSDVTCGESGANVVLGWTNNDTYDGGIDIVRDDIVIASLPDGTTSYSDTSPAAGTVKYRVVGNDTAAACGSSSPECTVLTGLAVEECSINVPSAQFGDNGVAMIQDTVTVADAVDIEDTNVLMEITTAFVGDLIIDVTSPAAITLRLHENQGGANDNLIVNYNDAGVVNAEPFDCDCDMQPFGPGSLADYDMTTAEGDWVLDIEDTFPTSGGGTLDVYCIRLFGDGGMTGGGLQFQRGDADNSGSFSGLVDGLFILNFGFVPGSAVPPCMAAVDADGNDAFSALIDGLYTLNFAFVPGSPPIPPPFDACGADAATTDALGCDMGSCNP